MNFIDFGGHRSKLKVMIGIIDKCGMRWDATLCVVIFVMGTALALWKLTPHEQSSQLSHEIFLKIWNNHVYPFYSLLLCTPEVQLELGCYALRCYICYGNCIGTVKINPTWTVQSTFWNFEMLLSPLMCSFPTKCFHIVSYCKVLLVTILDCTKQIC